MKEFKIHPKIQEQIDKLQVAQLKPTQDPAVYTIDKVDLSKVNPDKFIIGNYYRIKLSEKVINTAKDFTLHVNWNNGNIPEYAYMLCEITQKVGKMIKLQGTAYNSEGNEKFWQGWIPEDCITILEEL